MHVETCAIRVRSWLKASVGRRHPRVGAALIQSDHGGGTVGGRRRSLSGVDGRHGTVHGFHPPPAGRSDRGARGGRPAELQLAAPPDSSASDPRRGLVVLDRRAPDGGQKVCCSGNETHGRAESHPQVRSSFAARKGVPIRALCAMREFARRDARRDPREWSFSPRLHR